MQNQIRGLLFDKDGTLFDFNLTWAVWCRDFIAHLAGGDAAVRRRLTQTLGFDEPSMSFRPGSPVIASTLGALADAVVASLPGRDPAQVLALMRDTATATPQTPAVPLVPLFDDFKARGIFLGIATNDAEHPARAHLASAGVLGHFDFIAGYDSGFGAKPEPGMQHAFCAVTGLTPNQVAMIGDSTHDLHSGRAAGMVTIGVLTGPATRAELAPHADFILADIGEIPAWLGHPR